MERACYVYAILGGATPLPPGIRGLQDAPLGLVQWRELAAAVSLYAGPAPEPVLDVLLGHEAVVEALCGCGPALPVRFGTVLASEEVVEQALVSQYRALLDDLERVGNKVELGLTILWEAPARKEEGSALSQPLPLRPSGSSGPGTSYLQGRLARYQQELAEQRQMRVLLTGLQRALQPYTLEQRYRTWLEPRPAIRAAYLVQPGQVQEVQRAIEAERQARPDLRWLVSGPWPPYSFVSGAGKSLQLPGPEFDRRVR